MQHDNAFLALVNEVMPFIHEVTISEVVAKIQAQHDFYLIDVREDHEWELAHIPNALHIGRGILERDIGKHVGNKEACVVLYCGGGFRSALAAYNLQKMGFTNVKSMRGGISAWHEAQHPLIK